MAKIQRIAPCLMLGDRAEEAAKFYVSIFKNSKIAAVSYYGEELSKRTGQKKGAVLTVKFKLDGQEFFGLNGGPGFKFTEAVSLMVQCENQKEIDTYWEKLLAGGGREVECSWLQDKYGLSWQIVPANLDKLLCGDPRKSEAVMKQVIQMKKLDLKKLQEAYDDGGKR